MDIFLVTPSRLTELCSQHRREAGSSFFSSLPLLIRITAIILSLPGFCLSWLAGYRTNSSASQGVYNPPSEYTSETSDLWYFLNYFIFLSFHPLPLLISEKKNSWQLGKPARTDLFLSFFSVLSFSSLFYLENVLKKVFLFSSSPRAGFVSVCKCEHIHVCVARSISMKYLFLGFTVWTAHHSTLTTNCKYISYCIWGKNLAFSWHDHYFINFLTCSCKE